MLPPPSPRLPRLYTLDEAAAYARRTPKAMRQLRHVGRGPRFRKIGGRVLVDEDELARWLAGIEPGYGG